MRRRREVGVEPEERISVLRRRVWEILSDKKGTVRWRGLRRSAETDSHS